MTLLLPVSTYVYDSTSSLARDQQLAVTVTRSCWGLWDTRAGKLLAQLADAPLGAIVTHAVITPSGENVVTAESGNVVIWDTPERQVSLMLFYQMNV